MSLRAYLARCSPEGDQPPPLQGCGSRGTAGEVGPRGAESSDATTAAATAGRSSLWMQSKNPGRPLSINASTGTLPSCRASAFVASYSVRAACRSRYLHSTKRLGCVESLRVRSCAARAAGQRLAMRPEEGGDPTLGSLPGPWVRGHRQRPRGVTDREGKSHARCGRDRTDSGVPRGARSRRLCLPTTISPEGPGSPVSVW